MTFRLTAFGARAWTFGVSAAAHAAVFLAPPGHPPPGRVGAALAPIELQLEAPRLVTPEESPPVRPLVNRSAPPPTHTHPYPVPASHDWTPHDPSIEHPHASAPPVPAPEPAPAAIAAAPPRFTLVLSPTGGAGASSTAPPAPDDDHDADHETPFAETAVDVRAVRLAGDAPRYPEHARDDGREGEVRLELIVARDGTVESARVISSAGHDFDDAALEAARRSRYSPATKAGRAVRVRLSSVIQFRLR